MDPKSSRKGWRAALTALSEDERLFQSTVRKFAREEIGPTCARWTRPAFSGTTDPAAAVRHGPDGDRDPGGIWRAGRHLLPGHSGGGGAFGGGPVGGRDRGRAEHDLQQRPAALGRRGRRRKYLPRLAERHGGVLRAFGSRRRVGRVRPGDAGGGPRRPFPAERPQAVDHQRGRGGVVPGVRQRESGGGVQGHHGVPGGARFGRFPGGQEGRQAGAARVVHLRADSSTTARCRART
jgi:hypothetical protein